jgi:arabinofuranosyltransferase
MRRPIVADAVAAALLLLLLVLYVHRCVDLGRFPEEDAAMLLRYAEHVAEGRGIVWNVGEPPLDGATDFLFMLLVAGVHRLGAPVVLAAQGVGLVAHGVTALLLLLGVRRLHGASWALAVPGAVYLVLGPALRHAAAAYGTPLFALLAALAWLLALRVTQAPAGREARPALGFALAALALGLARPEGVFLGGFMLLGVLVGRGGQGARAVLAPYLGVFLTLGVAFFAWRWWYFGQPLPNPFYRKGGGVLHPHALAKSWQNLWTLGLPFLLALPLGLLVRASRRAAAAALVPVLLFVALWVLISDETNYVMRFRYPILPVLLLSWVPAWQALAARVLGPRRVPAWLAMVAAALVAVGLGGLQHARYRHVGPKRMGLYDAALVLHDYEARHLTLVTTEAGLLPLFSGWRAVDAWGLNDRFVAHHGEITEAYLDRHRPEVILFHAYFSPETPQSGPRVERRGLGPRWYRMVTTLKRYAESRGYTLAAVFGRDAWDTHWYWVRGGFAQSEEIAARLRGLDYYWDGQPTASFLPTAAPAP